MVWFSKAANGVVVVTTVAPKPGEMQIYYNFSGNVDFPDLSDYNLCDAAEKLEVERLSGLYSSDDPEKQIELTAEYYKKQHRYFARGGYRLDVATFAQCLWSYA